MRDVETILGVFFCLVCRLHHFGFGCKFGSPKTYQHCNQFDAVTVEFGFAFFAMESLSNERLQTFRVCYGLFGGVSYLRNVLKLQISITDFILFFILVGLYDIKK